MQIKILIAGRDKEALFLLEARLPDLQCQITLRHISNGHADPLYGIPDLPDLLIFHMDESNEAELAWLPNGQKDYADFLARINVQERRFDAAGVNFRKTGKSVAENLSGERCEKES